MATNLNFTFGIPVGADGKSAYDLAVENGYIGTLQEWLGSLISLAIPNYANVTNVCDLKQDNSYTAINDGFIQWHSEISGADNWARFILYINNIIVLQQTQAGLLNTGTYITVTLPTLVKVGDVITTEIGFAKNIGNVDNNSINFIPLR